MVKLRVFKKKESKRRTTELIGEDCPLLFGKYHVNRFSSFYEKDPSRLQHNYELDFAFVNAESQFYDNREGTHYIDAHGIMIPTKHISERLFEPRILELYKYARAFVIARFVDTGLGKELESPSDYNSIQCQKNFENRNFEKRCAFQRKTGFQVNVDFEKIQDKEDQKKIACETVDSLTEKIIQEFKITDQKIFREDRLSGGGKRFELNNNLTYAFEYPDHLNTGTLYFGVVSNENGTMDFHVKVINFCRDYLNNNFKGKLRTLNGDAVNMGLAGDGSYWVIDLSDIIPIKFSGKIFEGISTFQKG